MNAAVTLAAVPADGFAARSNTPATVLAVVVFTAAISGSMTR